MPTLIGVSPCANDRIGGEKTADAPSAAPVLMTVLRSGFQSDLVILILPRTFFVRHYEMRRETDARAATPSKRATERYLPRSHANVTRQSHASAKRFCRALPLRALYHRTISELLMTIRKNNLSSKVLL